MYEQFNPVKVMRPFAPNYRCQFYFCNDIGLSDYDKEYINYIVHTNDEWIAVLNAPKNWNKSSNGNAGN